MKIYENFEICQNYKKNTKICQKMKISQISKFSKCVKKWRFFQKLLILQKFLKKYQKSKSFLTTVKNQKLHLQPHARTVQKRPDNPNFWPDWKTVFHTPKIVDSNPKML